MPRRCAGRTTRPLWGYRALRLNGAPGVALPQPLSPSEAARVRHIFALQAAGAITEATRETGLLDNKLLLGPILADRYLGGWSHPSAADLDRLAGEVRRATGRAGDPRAAGTPGAR